MTRVTLEMMKECLNRFGWRNYKAAQEPLEKEGIIFTGWQSPEHEECYILTIDPMVEMGCLSFRVPEVLKASAEDVPTKRIANLCFAIGYLNYRLLLGKFAYDPSDGEVRFSVDIPIEENTFTYEQFVHCLGAAVHSVEKYAPALRRLAEGEQTTDEFIEWDKKHRAGELKRSVAEFLRQLLRHLDDDSDSFPGRGGTDRPRGGNGGDLFD
ncbi:MAG: YbjN domain-containing protein [Verrucomicrobiota bacterium]|nr:YbjN domain-containing protein [Verrucomicrobiota bacterium]